MPKGEPVASIPKVKKRAEWTVGLMAALFGCLAISFVEEERVLFNVVFLHFMCGFFFLATALGWYLFRSLLHAATEEINRLEEREATILRLGLVTQVTADNALTYAARELNSAMTESVGSPGLLHEQPEPASSSHQAAATRIDHLHKQFFRVRELVKSLNLTAKINARDYISSEEPRADSLA
jgi:hypothetical protein